MDPTTQTGDEPGDLAANNEPDEAKGVDTSVPRDDTMMDLRSNQSSVEQHAEAD